MNGLGQLLPTTSGSVSDAAWSEVAIIPQATPGMSQAENLFSENHLLAKKIGKKKPGDESNTPGY